jgi:hypothetical protein
MALKPCSTLRKGSERSLLALFLGSWTTREELFNGFEEVLIDTALTNWEDLVAPIVDVDKDPPHFEQTLQAMNRKYIGAEAHNIHFEYFHTLQKPMKAGTIDQAGYRNKLPETEPPLNDEQIKNVFSLFSTVLATTVHSFRSTCSKHTIVRYY